MIKKILLILVIISQAIAANAQLNINLVGQLTFPGKGDLANLWGYVDEFGNEYAVVGMEAGVSVVDISTPSAPTEVFFANGVNTIWREIKVYGDKAYITNEGGNGMMIIDLAPLPSSTALTVTNYTGSTYPFTTAHTLFIDENGYCYVFGANNGVGGAIILDLNVPTTDPNYEVGRYNSYYLHDGMVRGDTLWGAAINDGFFTAIDVSVKSSPVPMATQSTPSFFTHNCWISDDGQTLFTTDEVSNAFIGAYDVSDLSNISELDRVQSNPGQLVIPHNVYFLNDYVITSYYRDGVTIHDVSNPSNMIEVGNYDTSPAFSGNGFNGCWGVYPYFPSGLIIASDIENGLYVLGPTYTPASFLVGNVKDSTTSFNIDAVQIDIVSTTTSTNSNILGNYQTGLATAGTYSVSFAKFGYETKTITGVVLSSGNTTTLNVELVPIVPFTLQGQVIEAFTANPIANAKVLITNPLFTTTVQTNASGNFTVPNFIEDYYDVYIGKWSYNQLCLSNQNLDLAGNTHVFQLNKGYYDDFTFDLGWTVTGNPSSGDWVKDIPVGTTNGSDLANPGEDSPTDCMVEAYITGNGGGGAGTDDIDGGQTTLTSPIFDISTYGDAYLHFDRWFYNGGGFSAPNDSLVVELSNGSSVVKIDFSTPSDPTMSTWASKTIQVASVITPTATMQLIVRAMDLTPGHVVEGGFDKFQVVDSSQVGIAATIEKTNANFIYPNPFNDELTIQLNSITKVMRVEVYEVTGKMINKMEFNNTSIVNFKNNYKSGIYFIKVYGDGVLIKTQKIIKL